MSMANLDWSLHIKLNMHTTYAASAKLLNDKICTWDITSCFQTENIYLNTLKSVWKVLELRKITCFKYFKYVKLY